MLKLVLKPGESIRIGEDIVVQLDEHHNTKANLKVEAPREIKIKRQKWEQKIQSN